MSDREKKPAKIQPTKAASTRTLDPTPPNPGLQPTPPDPGVTAELLRAVYGATGGAGGAGVPVKFWAMALAAHLMPKGAAPKPPEGVSAEEVERVEAAVRKLVEEARTLDPTPPNPG